VAGLELVVEWGEVKGLELVVESGEAKGLELVVELGEAKGLEQGQEFDQASLSEVNFWKHIEWHQSDFDVNCLSLF
jgi:hypothetical protein